MNTKLSKWIRWIKTIRSETTNLLFFEEVFLTMKDTYIKNKVFDRDEFIFYDFIVNGYYGIAVMGIRRQLKFDGKSVSLVRLLSEIRDTPKILSKDYYCIAAGEDSVLRNALASIFDNHWGPSSSHVSADVVQKDINEFRFLAKNLETFADKRLAHFELGKMIMPPSFTEVSTVLERLSDIVHKYYLFINNTDATIRAHYNKRWINIFETWETHEKGRSSHA